MGIADHVPLRVEGSTGWSVDLGKGLGKPDYLYDLRHYRWLSHHPATDKYAPCVAPKLTPISGIVGSRRFPSHRGSKGYQALLDLLLTDTRSA